MPNYQISEVIWKLCVAKLINNNLDGAHLMQNKVVCKNIISQEENTKTGFEFPSFQTSTIYKWYKCA